MVTRLFAATSWTRVRVPPPSSRYVMRTCAADGDGFASRTNMSKNGPVAPSARNQRVAGACTPALPCPAL